MKKRQISILQLLLLVWLTVAGGGENSYLSAQNNKQNVQQNQKKVSNTNKNKNKNTASSNKNTSSNQKNNVKSSPGKQTQPSKSNSSSQKQKNDVKSSPGKQAGHSNKNHSSNQKPKNAMPVVSKKPQDLIAGFWYGGIRKSGAVPVVEIFEHKGKYYAVAFTSRNEKVDDSWLLDTENPDPKLRNRRRGNIIFIKDIRYNPDRTTWEGGTFYDTDTGKTYPINSVELTKNHKTLIFHLRGKKIEWAYAPNPEKFLSKRLPKSSLIKGI